MAICMHHAPGSFRHQFWIALGVTHGRKRRNPTTWSTRKPKPSILDHGCAECGADGSRRPGALSGVLTGLVLVVYIHFTGHRYWSENLYEERCMCHWTRMASRAVTRLYDDMLRSAGLRATQLAVLVAVGGDEVVSITALAKFISMDRSTLTRNLAPLEREGLIRVGNEGWRRSRTVEITRKGRLRLREALPLWEKAQDRLRQKLGSRKWPVIMSDLDDLIRAA